MPIYEYKGYDPGGGTKTGIVDADTPREARSRLRDQNVMVTELVLSDVSKDTGGDGEQAKKPRSSFRRMFRFEKRLRGGGALPIYTRQLATLLRSGIPLAQALGALIEQVEHRDIEAILRDVREQVIRGKSFGDALALPPEATSTTSSSTWSRRARRRATSTPCSTRLADYRAAPAAGDGQGQDRAHLPVDHAVRRRRAS